MKGIYKVMAVLVVLDVGLLVLSGIPAFKDAKHGADWVIGGIGWFGFLLTTLVLVVLAVTALVRRARERRTAAAQARPS
jgi:hypothetical protein